MNAVAAFPRGNGPDVVLVHGALGDHRQWAPIGNALERSFRVTAVSRRHHWPNPMPAKDAAYTYEGHRDDLVSFLASFADPVHLVGHSWGAGVALLTALSRPALVRSLALIEPAFGSLLGRGGPELEAELAGRATLLETTQRLARAGENEAASRALIDWLQDSDRGFDSLAESVRHGVLENAATVGPTFSAPPPQVTCNELRSLTLPVLVLYGARTRLFFRLVAERAAACLPNATLAAIAGCRHMSIVENPGAVAALLRDFLVQNQGTPLRRSGRR